MAIVKVPDYVLQTMEDAESIGWKVVRPPNSIKLCPPKGVKTQNIIISSKPFPTELMLHSLLERRGFLAFVRKHKDQAKASTPEPAAEQTDTEKKYPCPECAETPTPRVFDRPQALGLHRHQKHGVLGTSEEAVRKREQKELKKQLRETAEQAKTTAPAAVKEPETVPETPAPGLPDSVSAAVSALVYAVGNETASLRAENEKLRAFKDQVSAEVNNGNQTPVETVFNILRLCKDADQ